MCSPSCTRSAGKERYRRQEANLIARNTSNYHYQVDPRFTNDLPNFSSGPCIASGMSAWNGHGGITVDSGSPTNVFAEYLDETWFVLNAQGAPNSSGTGGTIQIPRNIATLAGVAPASSPADLAKSCLRIKKLIMHEMGHVIGLGHPLYGTLAAVLSIMGQGDPSAPYSGIDGKPDFIHCGDDSAVERAATFEGGIPQNYQGDIGGAVGCSLGGYWSDDNSCCHPEILAFAPAVGHYDYKPISHIKFPANNSNYGP